MNSTGTSTPRGNHFKVGDETAQLLRHFAAEIIAAGYAESRDWPYAFDRFDNGEQITGLARAAYAQLGRAAVFFADPFGVEMRDWLADYREPAPNGDWALWQQAARERLAKLEEANVLLAERQVELDHLRNALAGERQRADWFAAQAAIFEQAAAERLALIQKLSKRR